MYRSTCRAVRRRASTVPAHTSPTCSAVAAAFLPACLPPNRPAPTSSWRPQNLRTTSAPHRPQNDFEVQRSGVSVRLPTYLLDDPCPVPGPDGALGYRLEYRHEHDDDEASPSDSHSGDEDDEEDDGDDREGEDDGNDEDEGEGEDDDDSIADGFPHGGMGLDDDMNVGEPRAEAGSGGGGVGAGSSGAGGGGGGFDLGNAVPESLPRPQPCSFLSPGQVGGGWVGGWLGGGGVLGRAGGQMGGRVGGWGTARALRPACAAERLLRPASSLRVV